MQVFDHLYCTGCRAPMCMWELVDVDSSDEKWWMDGTKDLEPIGFCPYCEQEIYKEDI